MKTNINLSESFNELNTVLYDLSYKTINYSNLNENQKLDNLLNLNEGIFSWLFGNKDPEVERLSNEYQSLKQDYDTYKINGDETLAKDIEIRLNDIKAQINNYRMNNTSDLYSNNVSSNIQSVGVRSELDTNSIRPTYSQYIGNITNPNKISMIKGDKAVGPITDMMDKVSKLVWRKHWKTNCINSINERQINSCKAIGCDKAVYIIRMKIGICKTTVDPNGCEQTLNNMIKYWNDRKNQYLRKY